jgi:hypothetical protein
MRIEAKKVSGTHARSHRRIGRIGRIGRIDRRREGGIALIVTVLLLLLISASVINTIEFSGDEHAGGGRARATGKTMYAADSGIQLGMSRIALPRDLNAFTFALTDGTTIESRKRSEATPQDIESVGIGKPPDGYAINVGLGYVNEVFDLNVTSMAANGGVAELETKLASLQPNSGSY